MGEAKNKKAKYDRLLFMLTEELIDQGQLIAAGYAAYRSQVMPKEAGPTQVRECGLAFMAGAQHLFGSMMTILDPGEGVTADDEKRMEAIFKEMDEWTKQMAARHYPAQGSA